MKWHDCLTFTIVGVVCLTISYGYWTYRTAHWKVQAQMKSNAAKCILLLSDKYRDDQKLMDERVYNMDGRYRIE